MVVSSSCILYFKSSIQAKVVKQPSLASNKMCNLIVNTQAIFICMYIGIVWIITKSTIVSCLQIVCVLAMFGDNILMEKEENRHRFISFVYSIYLIINMFWIKVKLPLCSCMVTFAIDWGASPDPSLVNVRVNVSGPSTSLSLLIWNVTVCCLWFPVKVIRASCVV